MNPDFTLIWPLSCLKDGDHLFPPEAEDCKEGVPQPPRGFTSEPKDTIEVYVKGSVRPSS